MWKYTFGFCLAVCSFGLFGCDASTRDTEIDTAFQEVKKREGFAELPDESEIEGLEIATLAGGCFWCTEAVFEKVKGVEMVISGYAGGERPYPTYEMVTSGKTNHAESIQVYYDPEVVSYAELLDVFFGSAHDPTQVNRQGPDIGRHYRSIAFYRSDAEKRIIEEKMAEWKREWGKPLATEVVAFEAFYPAEEYHQDYDALNPNNPYIRQVSRPKVDKLEEMFPRLLKEEVGR